jgi:uncharacterized lipoprotein
MRGRFRSRARALAAVIIALVLAACSKHSETDRSRPAMNERRRDSTIAKSHLPGAGTVGKALAVSDSAAARASRVDSLLR